MHVHDVAASSSFFLIQLAPEKGDRTEEEFLLAEPSILLTQADAVLSADTSGPWPDTSSQLSPQPTVFRQSSALSGHGSDAAAVRDY